MGGLLQPAKGHFLRIAQCPTSRQIVVTPVVTQAETGRGDVRTAPLRWTRLSCHSFRHNAVRLQLHALAYNLANFLRSLALPREIELWSLTTLREKLIKIGARIVRHGRYMVFQFAEVAVPRTLFAKILRRIDRLRPRSPPIPA